MKVKDSCPPRALHYNTPPPTCAHAKHINKMPYVLAVIGIHGFNPENIAWKSNELADRSVGRGDQLSVQHAMAVVKREKLRFFVIPPAGEGQEGFSPVMTLGRSSKNLFNLPGRGSAVTLSKKHLSLRVGGDGVSFLRLACPANSIMVLQTARQSTLNTNQHLHSLSSPS